MNKIIRFLLIFVIVIGVVFSFAYSLLQSSNKNLNVVHSQISGVEYLEALHTLSISVANNMAEESNHFKTHQDELRKVIDKVIEFQEQNLDFKDNAFKVTLENIYKGKIYKDDNYVFLNSLNHRNYTIGDISKLLYVDDRELYLLGTLVTHYIPEFLISSVISHNIVKKFKTTKSLSNQDKIIFTQQNKLVYLSISEVEEIITLLDSYSNAKHLKSYILNIKNIVANDNPPSKNNWKYEKNNTKNYLKISHSILDNGYKLNSEIFKIIKELLQKKKCSLENEISYTKLILIFVLVVFSLLSFLYYSADKENFKKDIEIKNINQTLNKFVLFCKLNRGGKITYSSDALEKLTGYTNNELIGKTTRIFRHRKTDALEYKKMWDTVKLKEVYTGTILNRMKSGSSYWAEITIVPELDSKENIVAFSVYIIDVTQKKELVIVNQILEELSQIDTLTQIYNRLKLDTLMASLYKSYNRYNKLFSIMIIDIDYFKDINDTYGHLVGDEVLISLVQRVKESIRDTDVLGRWGGEEFMLICEETDLIEAYNLAQKIRKNIQNYQFKSIDTLTVSIGVAQIEPNISIKDFMKRADDALYSAKNSGRNRSVVYQKSELLQ